MLQTTAPSAITLGDASRRVLLTVIEDESATIGEDLSGDYGFPGLRGRLEDARDQLDLLNAVERGSVTLKQAGHLVPLVQARRAELLEAFDPHQHPEDVANQQRHIDDCDAFLQALQAAS